MSNSANKHFSRQRRGKHLVWFSSPPLRFHFDPNVVAGTRNHTYRMNTSIASLKKKTFFHDKHNVSKISDKIIQYSFETISMDGNIVHSIFKRMDIRKQTSCLLFSILY